jgi:hypothetical protein
LQISARTRQVEWFSKTSRLIREDIVAALQAMRLLYPLLLKTDSQGTSCLLFADNSLAPGRVAGESQEGRAALSGGRALIASPDTDEVRGHTARRHTDTHWPGLCYAMDFVHDRLTNGRRFKCLTMTDPCSKEVPVIEVESLADAQHHRGYGAHGVHSPPSKPDPGRTGVNIAGRGVINWGRSEQTEFEPENFAGLS